MLSPADFVALAAAVLELAVVVVDLNSDFLLKFGTLGGRGLISEEFSELESFSESEEVVTTFLKLCGL